MKFKMYFCFTYALSKMHVILSQKLMFCILFYFCAEFIP